MKAKRKKRGTFVQHIVGKPERTVVTRQKNRSKLGYKEVEKVLPAIKGRAIKHFIRRPSPALNPNVIVAYVNWKDTDGARRRGWDK